jgi:hypothetical protein
MQMTDRVLWALIHGMVFGGIYLLAFADSLTGLLGLRPLLVTSGDIRGYLRRLRAGILVAAVSVWLMVVVGTYVIYPWYRARPPDAVDATAQSEALREYPYYWLLASQNTAEWHEFGMVWKEHAAWIASLLVTVVAFSVVRHGAYLAAHDGVRKMVIALFLISFAIVGIAGLLGALITKIAPVL